MNKYKLNLSNIVNLVIPDTLKIERTSYLFLLVSFIQARKIFVSHYSPRLRHFVTDLQRIVRSEGDIGVSQPHSVEVEEEIEVDFVHRVFQGFNFLIVIKYIFYFVLFILNHLVFFLFIHNFHHYHQFLEFEL